ncbi:MAG: hypothetical protein IPP81_14750 [Chitinophagaceae bacterium]|nr:hypothetical protein [Chitinophagaceae bacterium]
MKTLLTCVVLGLVLAGCSTINSTTGSQAKIRSHKTIAILPFEVRFDLRNKNRQKFNEEELAGVRHFMALGLQQYLYNWLKNYSRKKAFTASIQNIDITDSILTEKKISYAMLYNMSRTELAKMFDVDAVLTPNVIFAQPNSEAASLLAIPLGAVPLGSGNVFFYTRLATQQMKMQVLLTDRESETSMWTFETKTNNSKLTKPSTNRQKENILYPLFDNIDETLIKFIRKFPYKEF